MNRSSLHFGSAVMLFLGLTAAPLRAQTPPPPAPNWPAPQAGDYVVRDFHFQSGGPLPEVRMHYYTLGNPGKDANGRTTTEVLILHGTGGEGVRLLLPIFVACLL